MKSKSEIVAESYIKRSLKRVPINDEANKVITGYRIREKLKNLSDAIVALHDEYLELKKEIKRIKEEANK